MYGLLVRFGRSRVRAVTMSVAALVAGGVATPACLSRPIEPIEPRRTSTLVEKFSQTKVDKIDIVLSIDDSGSMADKQVILARAVPDLLSALVNPACVDEAGNVVSQPAHPEDLCSEGSRREFEPVLDIHIGVISTSLGPRGSVDPAAGCRDDGGVLLTRSMDAGGNEGRMQTWRDLGFLAWDPAERLEPAGHTSVVELSADLEDMVRGVGQTGCGYEAQLESWYRFLIDPDPYAEVVRVGNYTELSGIDEGLLEQRASFLRPDSLVAIIMLSDENDCSHRAGGQGFFTAESSALHPLKARSECATDPNDPCCKPCGYDEGCPADPTCDDPVGPSHSMTNLNCYAQKQRYGFDFLYPVDRYVTG